MSISSAPISAILETVDDVFFTLNKQWEFDYANASAEFFFSKQDEELVGKNIWDEFPQIKQRSFYEACMLAHKNNKPISLEDYYEKANIWYEKNIYPSVNGFSIFFRDITKVKDAEKAIKISNERFKLVATTTNDMIWDWNLLTDEIWWNHNYNNLFGYDHTSVIHHINDWVKSVHPDDRIRVKDGIYKVIEEKQNFWSDEYRYLKKDGTILFIYDRGYVLYSDEGKPYRMIGSMLNITDRINAEQKVKQSEEKYRALVEQASDAIYIVDTTGKILTVNPSACKLSQYSEEQLTQMSVYDFLLEEDIVSNPLKFEELKAGKTVIIERRLKAKDGSIVYIETIANMLSDGRVLIFARDIGDRIKAQNDIIKEKNFTDSIINSLPGIFYMHDDKGNFLRWNKNLEKITGYESDEIKTMHPLELFIEEDRDLMLQKAREVLEKKEADVDATFLTKQNNTASFYFTGRQVFFEEKPCIIVIGIDSSEKKEAEFRLKKSYQDIRNLATHLTHVREEERKRIGREIHDELGQQLTAVKMDIAWIDKNTNTENKAIKNKLKNVIDLLDTSNKSVRRILTELSPGIIDNNGLIAALERLNAQFYQTTSIVINFDVDEPNIQLNQQIANCIFRVYQEALTNIMRYAHATKVSTSLQIVDDIIEISIVDNGKGFDTSLNNKNKTFGILGMKERVLSQNGKFKLLSHENKGTKIIIQLPYKP
jgi:PAS domain S-box-containing protein